MKRRFSKLLVANRGEIASRVFRSARTLGLGTVAVYSDADGDLPYVRDADEAVRIGPAPARESYLRVDRILEAARAVGADAIHPGFGFLAENADFAEAVLDAGLVWVGPSPAAIRAVGPKREAKALAKRLGVPVIEGFDVGADVQDRARALGFPILLKASAGGGGRGMRVVRSLDELPLALESATREAEAGFGDGTLLAERYVEQPRHVEVQILGDEHGNVVHLFERDCSVQRRHQKLIEESPAPGLPRGLLASMADCAVRIGRAIGYTSAGTVEFVVGRDGFAFLEVNTRLQVEHPVTEGILPGLDLVEEQLRVARGETLRFDQASLDARRTGAAIEVRLCAEDPYAGNLPQAGSVVLFEVPEAWRSQPWLRIERGVASGSEVSVHYDSMLAKLIVTGADRDQAIDRMLAALTHLRALGLETNQPLLRSVLMSEAFRRGAVHTGMLDALELTPPELDPIAVVVAAVGPIPSERALPYAFHSHGGAPSPLCLIHRGQALDVRTEETRTRDLFRVRWGDHDHHVRRLASEAGRCTLELGSGVRHEASFAQMDDAIEVFVRGQRTRFERVAPFRSTSGASAADACVAAMPAKVLRVLVREGDRVESGQPVIVLEAMKMEHTLRAPHRGHVRAVHTSVGAQVRGGQVLLEVGEV